MLVDAAFAEWIRTGVVDGRGAGADRRSADERFGAHERLVAARTNGLHAAGGHLQLPWPRALGTPPWGARAELEHGAADPDADYATAWLRFRTRPGRERAYAALRARVREGRPALLYIGNAWLPRHVVLVLPASAGQDLDVYEPSVGRVTELSRAAFVDRRLGLAGWDVAWAVIWADRAAMPRRGG